MPVNVLPGVLCLDRDWKIRGINDAAADFFVHGKTGADLTGEGFDVITGIDAAGAPPSRELVQKALESKFRAAVTEYIICGESGTSIVCFSADRDVEPLERRIAEMSRLNKKLFMISMFAAGVAHDYNNALTAVMGNISLAKFEAEENHELADLLKDAEKASLKIKAMTERLSLYTRGIRLDKSRFNIVEVAEKLFNSMLSGFSGKRCFKSSDSFFEIEADQKLIEMAIESIVENAAEAACTSEGSIELEIISDDVKQEQGQGFIPLVAGKYIKIAVKDNGAGLNPDMVKSIFDPYYTAKDGHDGIGLALAFAIIKRHRGYIMTEPVQGGSVFSIYLPLF